MNIILFRRLVFGLALIALLGSACGAVAQTNYYSTNGVEYPVVGTSAGNHMFPDVALSSTNGFMVWQDNVTDASGWGISAAQLSGPLAASTTFRVNQNAVGNQTHPRVARLNNGGAVFVWQGGRQGFEHIYAQFLTPANLFVTNQDIQVNTFTNYHQAAPAVAVLTNGNVVVVWGSYNEAGTNSMLDVYGQILTPTGAKVGGEFLVNTEFTSYNQRTPGVAALPGGGFVVTWTSEQELSSVAPLGTNTTYTTSTSAPEPSISVFARVYSASATAVTSPFQVNTDANPCASPEVAVASDGSYMIVWCENSLTTSANGWDIYSRVFTNNNSGGAVSIVNTHRSGDQFLPRISVIGQDYFVVWTSLAQDGSREGVYGQFVHSNGGAVGPEIRVNTTTPGSQMEPAVASDGVAQFFTVWSGVNFTNSPVNFDLYGQRFANSLALLNPMAAPFVWAPFTVSNGVYQPQLVVTWPSVLGLSVSNYEVYVDGATTPTGVVATNQWTMKAVNGLSTNATHSFTVDYVVGSGRRSPVSPSASGTTWSGLNWQGIPYEWMAGYFGGYAGGKYTTRFWPAAGSLLAPGVTLTSVFVSGGSPLDSTTWLTTQITHSAQGMFLSWNTQPGATYQVQSASGLMAPWINVGLPRFAEGTSDSIYVGGGSAGYYRVILLR